jgi:restriction system protein
MARPSRKERQNTNYLLVMIPTVFILFLLIMNGITNMYLLGGIFFGGIILGNIAASFVPNMRKKENKRKNQYTGLPSKKRAPTKKGNLNKTHSKNVSTASKKKESNKPYNIMELDELLIVPLEKMSGFDFEELCFQYFKHNYKYVEQTNYSQDKGVDFIYKDSDGFRVAVQVKHRINSKNKITVSEINQINGAKRNHKCTKAMFITSAGYTRDALNLAEDLHIETKDFYWIENKVLRWRNQEAKKRKLS